MHFYYNLNYLDTLNINNDESSDDQKLKDQVYVPLEVPRSF